MNEEPTQDTQPQASTVNPKLSRRERRKRIFGQGATGRREQNPTPAERQQRRHRRAEIKAYRRARHGPAAVIDLGRSGPAFDTPEAAA